MAKSLPSYENPPIIEVVCGVQFETIYDLHAPLTGKFWAEIETDFPTVQMQPTLEPVRENLSGEGSPQTMTLAFSTLPPLPRIWFISADETELVQLQSDRFLFNWRKQDVAPVYPRFEAVFSRFMKTFEIFGVFLDKNEIIRPKINQFELTYINGIDREEVNGQIKSIHSILPDLAWRESGSRLLREPEHVALNSSFLLPDSLGRLHLAAGSALNVKTGLPALRLELTARGIDATGDSSIEDWFAVAHEWIVKAFADVTDEGLQTGPWNKHE